MASFAASAIVTVMIEPGILKTGGPEPASLGQPQPCSESVSESQAAVESLSFTKIPAVGPHVGADNTVTWLARPGPIRDRAAAVTP